MTEEFDEKMCVMCNENEHTKVIPNPNHPDCWMDENETKWNVCSHCAGFIAEAKGTVKMLVFEVFIGAWRNIFKQQERKMEKWSALSEKASDASIISLLLFVYLGAIAMVSDSFFLIVVGMAFSLFVTFYVGYPIKMYRRSIAKYIKLRIVFNRQSSKMLEALRDV